MNDIAFADAARPMRVVCLRLRLQTYSLAHEAFLLNTRNPLRILSETDFNALPAINQCNALAQAVLICSRTLEENEKPHRWIGLWSWFIRKTNWPLEIAEFRNYLTAGRSLPPTPDPEVAKILSDAKGYGNDAPGRPFGAPLLAQLINFAPKTGLTVTGSPLNLSYALVGWLYFSDHESNGRYRIENFEEWEETRNIEKIKADVAAEQAERIARGEPSPLETQNSKLDTSLATPPPDLG